MKITKENVRKYIYDDYGVDVVKLWYDIKHSKFIDISKKVLIVLFSLLLSGILSGSVLALVIVYPIQSLFVDSILLLGLFYIMKYINKV